MSWIQKLYETYDACAGNRNINDSDELCPVGYSAQNAHIDVVLDNEGNFRRANLVQRGDKSKTLIPVTEQSAGRTSGEAPHPLCDSLQYCAADYVQFGGARPSYFDAYLAQLKAWSESAQHSHAKVRAIYAYVSKRHLIQDLSTHNLLAFENGKLSIGRKGAPSENDNHSIMKTLTFDDKDEKDQAKVFVRWSVEGDDPCSHTWEDKTLFEAWSKYMLSFESKLGFCYVTGRMSCLAQKHPAKLRSGKDGAKLISSNDTSGYTFLGRFTGSEQVAGVSSEVTQKAHSALRWLIGRKQAFRSGNQVFVSWAVSGSEIPDPWAHTLDFLGDGPFQEMPNTSAYDVGQSYALRLRKKIAGYKASIEDSENIVVMGLDSATPGRMAITFYRELTGSEFLERIELWHQIFAWQQNYGKGLCFIGAPSPKDIAAAAFGVQIEGKNGAKLLHATIERLLPCIIDCVPFPQDLVLSAVQRASNRNGFKKERIGKREYEIEWNKCLGIACSIFKGINQERSYHMALEDDKNTRDYLYGRLLAVSEKIESMALYFAKEQRDTTAARLMQRFADHPYSTWRTIETALAPYYARIRANAPSLLEGYKELLDNVHVKFVGNDYKDDSRLTGEYLLGYHCQRDWFGKHKREYGQWVIKNVTETESQGIDFDNQ